MDRSSPPRRPLLVALYAALALATVVVLFQITDSSTTETMSSGSTTTTLDRSRQVPLASLVPGLTGTLQVVEGDEEVELVSWGAGSPPLIGADLPAGDPDQIGIDAAGELVAISLVGASSRTADVLVGSPTRLITVSLDVTSFAWHLTEPGSMAAISVEAGSDQASLVKLRIESGEVSAVEPIRPVDPQDLVLAWGPWGFLLLNHDAGANRIVLIDAAGGKVWSRPAHWAYASPNGDVLISFYNNEIREFQHLDLGSDPTGSGEWFEPPSLGVTSIGWSPDGEQLAIVSRGGNAKSRLETYDNGGALLDQIPLEWHVWDVHWSQDGRFLVMPAIREGTYAVLFYNIEEEHLTAVEFEKPIRVAAMAG